MGLDPKNIVARRSLEFVPLHRMVVGLVVAILLQLLQPVFDLFTNEWCPSPLEKVNPSRPCQLYRTTYWDCDDDGFDECPRDDIYDSAICPGYTPTPTPTPTPGPTPVPTCDPATMPNPTNCRCEQSLTGGLPYWACFCFYIDGGHLWD